MFTSKIPKIIPIWKPVGESTHRISKRISEVYNIPSSHTGTLDPMAEGVIVVLTGETRLKKYEYAHWKKTYEFEIVLGLSADSLDGLGHIEQRTNVTSLDEEKLRATLQTLIGSYSQKVPNYAAIKVKGKELHWWARNNRLNEIEIPSRHGEIYDLKLLEIVDITFGEVAKQTIEEIKKVEGDLRQELAIQCWEHIAETTGTKRTKKLHIQVQMSKGLYVRQLSQDILGKLGLHGITLNIKRTYNGIYTLGNCYKVAQLFSSNSV